MNKFTKRTLGELCHFQAGNAFPPSAQGCVAGKYPFIKVSDLNLSGNEIFIFKSNNWMENKENYNIHKNGSIVFAKIGIALTYNRRRILTRDTIIDNNMMSATASHDVNGRFLYYLLCTIDFNDISSGSALPYLTVRDLNALTVFVPPKNEQYAIASILSSLDDKIDLNRRMNETLEAMARALFRDWFVDFGPTRAKMTGEAPYLAPELWELFPDKLDDEGKPEGWQITTLGNLAANCGESIYPEKVDPLTPYVGLEHLPRRSISLSTWDRAEKITSGKSVFHEGNILFGKLRPYFHKVVIAPVNGICSTDIVVIDAKKDIWRSIVRLICSSKDFVDFTDRTSQGTKMPRTSWGTMKAYELIQVPDNVCFAFENITNTFFVKIQKNIMQSRNLAQLRDLLLPKLMSGEISIRDAEKMVEDAA